MLLLHFIILFYYSSPGPFTVGIIVSDRTNVQCYFQLSPHFRRENKTANSTMGVIAIYAIYAMAIIAMELAILTSHFI